MWTLDVREPEIDTTVSCNQTSTAYLTFYSAVIPGKYTVVFFTLWRDSMSSRFLGVLEAYLGPELRFCTINGHFRLLNPS